MSEPGGSTDVGSIIAYLRLNRSDWDREIDAARRRAEELNRVNPDIRIDTNAALAAAQLAELRRIADRLNDTRPDIRVRTNSDETHRALGLTLKDLLLLAPAAITVGAVMVGAIAGLVPTAGAAVLAIFGIRDAWRTGALQGTTFARAVRTGHDELTRLKQTAAAGVLPGLQVALQGIEPLFGKVNGIVGIFSRQLGQIVASLAPGLIRVFTALQPLFTQIGDALVLGAQHLADWAQNGQGLQHFVAYVQANLPVVLHTLGQLGTLFGHLVTAAAPLGPIILRSIGIIASILNAIPTPVLTGLITALLAARVAFLAFRVAVIAANLAMEATPVGLILTAVAAIAAFAFGMSQASNAAQIQAETQQAAKAAMDSYAESVKKSTDALSGYNREQTLKNLSDAGALTQLDALHASGRALTITYDDLVDAVTGSKEAYDRVMGTLRPYGLFLTGPLQGALQRNRDGLHAQIDATEAYQRAQHELNATLTAHELAERRNASAMGVSVSKYQSAEAAAKKNTDQTRAQTLAFQLENDAASLLQQTLDRLSGRTIGTAEAQTALRQANLQVLQALKQNGTAIDGGTQKAVNNQQALQQQARAAITYAEAIGKATGSSKAETAQLRSSRDALEANLRSQGKLTPALKSYIDGLYSLSKLHVPPTKLDVDRSEAVKQISQLQYDINEIKQGRVPGLDADSAAGKRVIADLQSKIDYLRQTHKPRLDVDAALALSKLIDFENRWNALHSKSIVLSVTQTGTINQSGGNVAPSGTRARGAGGGTVVGGTAGADSVPALLMPGEEVIRQPYAGMFRPLLKAINAGKAIMHAAAGGTAGTGKTPPVTYDFTLHGPINSGITAISQLIKGDIPASKLAAKELGQAVDEAFELKGVQAQIAAVRNQLTNLRDYRDQVEQAASSGFDPGKYGSVGDLLTGLRGQSAGNASFASEIKTLTSGHLNKAFLTQLIGEGPNATLAALAAGGKGDIAAVNKALGTYDSSLAAVGKAATLQKYGTTVGAADQRLAVLEAHQTRLVTGIDKLVGVVAAVTKRPVSVSINGKEIAHAVIVDKQFEAVVDELGHIIKTGRKGH